MAKRCPICFSKINDPNNNQEAVWTNDPITLKDGLPYSFDVNGDLISVSDITQREYKGFYNICAQHIKELQDDRQQKEIDIGILEAERTTFSPVNTTGLFIVTKEHIQELRASTEKILTALGTTKNTYFNYDDEGNQIRGATGQEDAQLDWTKPLDLNNWVGHIRATHIEDLRHYLVIGFTENFTPTALGIVNNIYGLFYITNQNSGLPPSSYGDVQSRLKLLKREGTYLGTRLRTTQSPLPSPPFDPGFPALPGWWSPYSIVTNINYIDLDGNLTSNLYPQPQGNKFTWSLYQQASPISDYPFKSFYTGLVIGHWSNLVFTQTDFGMQRICNFSNSKVSFISKASGNNKDVLFQSYVSASHSSIGSKTAIGGAFTQELTYHFNTSNYYEGSENTKISFKIEDWNKGYNGDPLNIPGLTAKLEVQIIIEDENQQESSLVYTIEAGEETGAVVAEEHEILLNSFTALPSIYYIKRIKFVSNLSFQIAGKFTPSGNGWLSFKLITPIIILN